MMQLLCNGVFLDMEDNARMTFQKSNPLFAFDDLKCERTTEFSIPATPKNNRVFSLAKDPAYYGEGMRRRFDAQLVNGVCVKNGFIYVSKYENGAYKVIFVTGELFGLQRFKNSGKIEEYMTFTEHAAWSGGRMASSTPTFYECVNYVNVFNHPFPSVNMGMLISACASHFGVSIGDVNNMARIIPASLSPYKERERYITSRYSSGASVNTLDVAALSDVLFYTRTNIVAAIDNNTQIEQQIVCYYARQNVRIKFPKEMSSDWFLCDLKQTDGNMYGTFIGDYSFQYIMYAGESRARLEKSGEPLSGRTIDIQKGQVFMLVHCSDFIYEYDSSGVLTQGWVFRRFQLTISHSQSVLLSGADINFGDSVFLQDNLPDVTFVDLLKIYAAINGKVLNYTDADGITFDDLDFDSWGIVEMKNVLSINDVQRTFADYAQQNIIQFDSDDFVMPSERIMAVYTIDNDNLAETNELQKIPFSEGAESYVGGFPSLLIRNEEDKPETDKDTIGMHTTDGNPNMERAELPKNQNLQHLCDASTCITIKVSMTQYEYERIGAKTRILFRGILYVWTSAKWVNDTAEFTLAKI